MPIHALLLQSIPESLAFISLGLSLAGVWPPFRRVVGLSVLYSVLTYVVRRLPVYFGVHSLILVVLLIFILRYGLKISFTRASLASLLGFISLALVETTYLPIIVKITGISISQAVRDPWLRVIFPIPQELFLGLLAYICWRRGFSLVPPAKEDKYRV
ncbi:MAG: hypothetical protein PWP65_1920 [Clostridia bacterium]|nr:hypothetical protein [Clostridia bacterium]